MKLVRIYDIQVTLCVLLQLGLNFSHLSKSIRLFQTREIISTITGERGVFYN